MRKNEKGKNTLCFKQQKLGILAELTTLMVPNLR